jgi:hypothetical protein
VAEPKTRPRDANVEGFLKSVKDPRRQADARAVRVLMERITRRPPRLWGSSIVGFGRYTYTYASGRSGDWPLTGFSPRKQALTLYIMSGFDDYEQELTQLGEFTTGKSCLYEKDLAKVDQQVLARLIRKSVAHLRKQWPTS